MGMARVLPERFERHGVPAQLLLQDLHLLELCL